MFGAYKYRGKPVFVENYQAYGSNGGVCNFVTFRFIRKDGSLGKRSGDYGPDNFKPLKYKLKIELKKTV